MSIANEGAIQIQIRVSSHVHFWKNDGFFLLFVKTHLVKILIPKLNITVRRFSLPSFRFTWIIRFLCVKPKSGQLRQNLSQIYYTNIESSSSVVSSLPNLNRYLRVREEKCWVRSHAVAAKTVKIFKCKINKVNFTSSSMFLQ